jgi:hypothetical protein
VDIENVDMNKQLMEGQAAALYIKTQQQDRMLTHHDRKSQKTPFRTKNCTTLRVRSKNLQRRWLLLLTNPLTARCETENDHLRPARAFVALIAANGFISFQVAKAQRRRKKVFRERRFAVLTSAGLATTPFILVLSRRCPMEIKNRQHCNLQPHFLQFLCRFCKNLFRPSSLLPCNRQPLSSNSLTQRQDRSPTWNEKTSQGRYLKQYHYPHVSLKIDAITP